MDSRQSSLWIKDVTSSTSMNTVGSCQQGQPSLLTISNIYPISMESQVLLANSPALTIAFLTFCLLSAWIFCHISKKSVSSFTLLNAMIGRTFLPPCVNSHSFLSSVLHFLGWYVVCSFVPFGGPFHFNWTRLLNSNTWCLILPSKRQKNIWQKLFKPILDTQNTSPILLKGHNTAEHIAKV